MRVLLIAGGWSDEREVSLSGAANIKQALIALGHEVTFFDPSERFNELVDVAGVHDFAFINMHGCPGEDGLIQAVLDAAKCPYQGSGPRGSFLALNKTAAKQIFKSVGLSTPRWAFLPGHPGADWRPALEFPLFIKPNDGGSSVGMSLVRTPAELPTALEKVFSVADTALVEEAVDGIEVTCTVLGGEALPTILIRPLLSQDYFDYDSKYAKGGAEEICPAPIDEDINARIQAMAVKAHEALGLSVYSRADFMVKDGVPYILEVNTLPGMTSTSLTPQSAAAVGLDFQALIGKLIELGIEDHAK